MAFVVLLIGLPFAEQIFLDKDVYRDAHHNTVPYPPNVKLILSSWA